MNFGVILLAGGTGTRMQSSLPKQFLPLGNKKIAHHSLDLFCRMPEVKEIVIVCDLKFRRFFSEYSGIKWALPGCRRQDSVYNGLQQLDPHTPYVCVHDSCRPLITRTLIERVFLAAKEHGASSAGMPIRYTIKEVNEETLVINTPNRERFWEIQTPQILKTSLLIQGFEEAVKNHCTVTDDASLVELLSLPVKLVEGSYANLKITTPEDLAIASILLESHG